MAALATAAAIWLPASGTAATPGAADGPRCLGAAVTIAGTDGPDQLRGTPGPDVIDGGDVMPGFRLTVSDLFSRANEP